MSGDGILRIGDSVSLYSQECGGYLFGECPVDSVVSCKPSDRLNPSIPNFQASVFKITFPNKYKANKKYFVLKKKLKGVKAPTPEQTKALSTAKKLAASETEDNIQEQHRQSGKVLTYGQMVELHQLYSGKIMSASTSDAARLETTNMRIELVDFTARSCYFKVMPRFKVRAEGDIVREGDQIVLESVKTAGSYVHAGKSQYDDGVVDAGLFEVNLSVSPSAFSIYQFSSSADSALVEEEGAKEYVRGCDVIRLFHREVEAYIAAEGGFHNERPTENVHLRVRKMNPRKPHSLKPPTAPSMFWQIEFEKAATTGSVINWEQNIRLRHMTTRQFLSVRKVGGDYRVELTHDRTSDSIFRLHAVIKEGNTIEYNNYTRIEHPKTKTWLHALKNSTYVRTENIKETAGAIVKEGFRETLKNAVSSAAAMMDIPADRGVLLQLSVSTEARYDDAYTITRVKLKDVRNFNLVAGLVPLFQWYSRSRMQGRELTSSESALYVNGNNLLNEFMLDKGMPVRRRQKILRHLKLVDLLVNNLRAPFQPFNPKGIDISTVKNHNAIYNATSAIYKTIENYLKGNSRKNEIYVARFIPHFLAQIGVGLAASLVITELVSDNLSVIDRIQPPIIDFFLDILDRKQEARFLKFLRVCCVCEGGAVRRNQNYITEALFKKNALYTLVREGNDILVRLPTGALIPLVELARDVKRDESRYLRAQLKLFLYLSHGRNFVVPKIIIEERQFLSFDLCLAGVSNKSLNPIFRSLFARVINNLFVDVEPYINLLDRVQFSHVWGDFEKIDNFNEVTTFAHKRLKLPSTFPELRNWLETDILPSNTLMVAENRHYNKFLCNVMEIVHNLVSFGCYSTRTDMERIIQPIISFLDGRDDKESDHQEEKDRLEWVAAERFAKSAENKAMCFAKHAALEVLELIFNFRFNARLEHFLHIYHMLESHQFVGKGASTISRMIGKKALQDLNLDPQLLKLAELTKNATDAESVKLILTKVFETTNFVDPNNVLSEILLDLSQYQYTKMNSACLRVLNKLYTQNERFFSNAVKAQILLVEDSINAHKLVSKSLPKIRRLGAAKLGKEQEQELLGILTSLCDLLVLPDDQNEPHPRNQLIMQNADVVIDLFELLSKKVDLSSDEMRGKYAGLCEIFGVCFKILGRLARKNSAVQSLLFDRIDFLLSVVGAEKEQALALAVLFDSHKRNCLEIREVHIQKIVESLAEHRLPEQLKLLQSIIKLENLNLAIKRNQNSVVKFLMQNRSRTILLVSNEENEKRTNLLRSKADSSDPELLYHIEMVDLLATCAEGENRFIESMCQTIFTTQEILAVFSDPKIPLVFKASYIRFLLWVYMNTSSEGGEENYDMADVIHVIEFWNFIPELSKHLRIVAEKLNAHRQNVKRQTQAGTFVNRAPDIPKDDIDLITESIVPFLQILYEKYFDTKNFKEILDSVLDTTQEAAKALISLLDVANEAINEKSNLRAISSALLTISTKVELPQEALAKLRSETAKEQSLFAGHEADISDSVRLYRQKYAQEAEINDRLNHLVNNLQTSYNSDPISPFLKNKNNSLPLGEEFVRQMECFAQYDGRRRDFQGLRPFLGRLVACLDNSAKTSATLSEKEFLAQEMLDVRLLKILRGICEAEQYKFGTSKDDLERSSELVFQVQNALNKHKAALICTKHFNSSSEQVVLEALASCVAMLEGGNKNVQAAFEKFFLTSREETFFADVRIRILSAMAEVKERRAIEAQQERDRQKRRDLTATLAQHQATRSNISAADAGAGVGAQKEKSSGKGVVEMEMNPVGKSKSGNNNVLDKLDNAMAAQEADMKMESEDAQAVARAEYELVLVLRLLQLLCEGHNAVLKNYLREQPDNIKSFNLVKETMLYLNVLIHNIHADNFELVSQIMATIVEFIQGNPGNQVVCFDNKLIDCCNTVFRQHTFKGCTCPEIAEIKDNAAVMILSLLEENTAQSVFFAKELAQQLDISAIHENMTRYKYESQFERKLGYDPEDDDCPDPKDVGFNYFSILINISDVTGEDYNGKPYVMASNKGSSDSSSGEGKKIELNIVDGKSASNSGGSIGNSGTMSMGSVSSATLTSMARNALEKAGTSKAYLPSSTYLNAPSSWNFYKADEASVELLKDGELHRIHFRVRNRSALRDRTKEELLWNVDRSSPTDKITDFLERSEEIREKMTYQQWLLDNTISAFFVRFSPVWYWSVMILTALLNCFILAGWTAPEDEHDWNPITPSWYNPNLYIFGGLHILFSAILFIEHFLTHPPAHTSDFFSLTSLYYFLFLGMSVAGIVVRGYFYCFHLLHIVIDNDLLIRVISSVTKNGKSLLWVAALGVIIIYIYSIASFAFLRDGFDQDEAMFCDTAWQCFITSLNFGLRNGGGLADTVLYGPEPLDWSYVGVRILYDLSFFIIITTIGLNIIFGIIVDTFSELRDEKWQIEEDMTSNCFICSIRAYDFERYASGFEHHVKKEHNMWAYLFYLIYLHDKDSDEYSGMEHYVMSKLKVHDTSFFPINRAMSLQKSEDEVQTKLDDILKKLSLLNTHLEKEETRRKEEVERLRQQEADQQLDSGR